MRVFEGRIKEIRLDAEGRTAAWIACPQGAIPAPGQYVRAHNIEDRDAALGTWLFPGEINMVGFLALPPIPASWNLGIQLDLWRPLGTGFKLPWHMQRMALAALGDTAARLLPLIDTAMKLDCSVALFTDVPMLQLPSSVEVYPLASLPEALDWPQFLALDVPAECLPALRTVLGLRPGQNLSSLVQALVYADMPCSGLADCGVCAVSARRGWKLVCKDGPVFDLNQLEW
jgi:Iron-sulfur cluster binding domain of dihydroorotate dehydrogenase B